MSNLFFILAGETSGDNHAASLMTAMKALDPDARFVGMGGPRMAAAGLEIAKDLDGMQVIGFWEVARQYGFFKRVFYQLLDRVKQERPRALICVDYPGFNLRFAKEVRKLDIPVLYYIVPQVWAWKAMRAKSMVQFVDRAFCVFEFEPPFFKKFGLKTEFVGHPLVDHVAGAATPELRLSPGPKTVALLPGSRTNEFNAHCQSMCEGFNLARERVPNLRALLSVQNGMNAALRVTEDKGRLLALPSLPGQRSETFIQLAPHCDADDEAVKRALESGHAHTALLASAADFSVVKSGTSTLEAGLAGNPMCVVYRASPISYFIANLLVNIPVFSLVNIVLGRYAVPELPQGDVNPARLANEIERGLNDAKYRERQQAALAELPGRLGGPGASARAAKGMLDFLNGK